MTVKTLLPNQCDYLHPFYGADNCCLCKANLEIEQLKKRVLELEARQDMPWYEPTGVRVADR